MSLWLFHTMFQTGSASITYINGWLGKKICVMSLFFFMKHHFYLADWVTTVVIQTWIFGRYFPKGTKCFTSGKHQRLFISWQSLILRLQAISLAAPQYLENFLWRQGVTLINVCICLKSQNKIWQDLKIDMTTHGKRFIQWIFNVTQYENALSFWFHSATYLLKITSFLGGSHW